MEETLNVTQESSRKLILTPLNEVRRGKPGGSAGPWSQPSVEMMRGVAAGGQLVRRRTSYFGKGRRSGELLNGASADGDDPQVQPDPAAERRRKNLPNPQFTSELDEIRLK